jgi:hypothetical protein
MKTALALLAATAVLAAAPARAQFEGRLDYAIKRWPGAASGGGTTTVWIGPAGARSETSVKVSPKDGAPLDLHLVTLWRKAEPNRSYLVNDARKVYGVMDADAARDEGPGAEKDWKVERLGKGSVAGYACDRARVTSGSGTPSELCVTTALGRIPLTAFQAQRSSGGFPAALQKAGLEGVPVRWASSGKEGKEEQFVMELVSARKEKVPASRFQVPAGYQQTSAMGVMLSPEQAKQASEAMKQVEQQMKNMSPEQRKQMEQMMKQYGLPPSGK